MNAVKCGADFDGDRHEMIYCLMTTLGHNRPSVKKDYRTSHTGEYTK